MRDVVAALMNEPYPALLLAAQQKLFELNPKLANRGSSLPSKEEEQAAKLDLLNFISVAEKEDSNLGVCVSPGRPSLLCI